MGKINQGIYEVFTTKSDAIDKLMQMQGICRETNSADNLIEFSCMKNGKIIVTNPATRKMGTMNSTNLYGEVIEQDNKTYITFYTAYSKSNSILKMFFFAIDIIICVVAVINIEKMSSLYLLLFCTAFFVFELISSIKEKGNSNNDSDILIRELKNRIDAVNNWDK